MLSTLEIKSWDLYFTREEFTAFNKEIALVGDIRREISVEEVKKVRESRQFICTYAFYQKFPSLKCLSCAVSELIYENYKELIHVETLINPAEMQEIDSFSYFAPETVNSLIKVTGTVCRVGCKQLENSVIFFECTKCRKICKKIISKNVFQQPSICSCKNKTFHFLSNHPEMITMDKQEIKLQELYASEVPQSITVSCYNSFVGICAPGDVVEIVGIVKAELLEDSYTLKLECNNLSIIKGRIENGGGNENKENALCFEKLCENLKNNENVLGLLANNLFLDVVGNELIKVGLILSLFGGTRKYVGNSEIRPEIHVLIVGDPGLGKSKLLLDAVKILPKSTYISGNASTSVGLTVSITHDPASGEFMADAGALVLSDRGICCIDEFDKIDDHSSLFEAMEEQTVTVAKGGVICSVPARATIIAASNPKHGHFNSTKSIRDNLKFDTALLSRFDLIFVLQDNLTAKENYEISNQILKKKLGMSENMKSTNQSTSSKLSQLMKKIKTTNCFYEETAEKIDLFLLKKYVEYVRSTCFPVLSTGAQKVLKDFYMELRKTNKTVSTRHLESLMRISESFAKVEVKSIASEKHAKMAVKFYRRILSGFHENMESSKKVKLEDLLMEYSKENNPVISLKTLSEIIEKSGAKKGVREMVEILNYRGILVKRGKDEYKINI
ncbi:Mcm8 [Nucleospora cyclopteri]